MFCFDHDVVEFENARQFSSGHLSLWINQLNFAMCFVFQELLGFAPIIGIRKLDTDGYERVIDGDVECDRTKHILRDFLCRWIGNRVAVHL